MTHLCRTAIVWLIVMGVGVAPAIVWLASTGDLTEYWRYSVPPGQLLYVLCKLFGLLAVTALWLQGMTGLARRSPALRGFPIPGLGGHRVAGLFIVAAALSHCGLSVAAVSLRTGHFAWKLLLPNFSSGYLVFYQSLGLLALWLMVLGIFAGWRLSKGVRGWRAVHFVWAGAFALVFVHSFAIGSESRFGAMRYVFVFMVVSLVVAITSRIVSGRKANAVGRVMESGSTCTQIGTSGRYIR